MNLAFRDLKYKRPDFNHLSVLYQKIMKQLDRINQQGFEFIDLKENFEAYSNYYLYCISMQHLYQLKKAFENQSDSENQDDNKGSINQEDQELILLKKEIIKAKDDYIILFSKIADSDLKYSKDSLENSSILNQARRVAKTYGQVDSQLIKAEQDLKNQYDYFYYNTNIELNAPNPQIIDSDFKQDKKYNIYLPDFHLWLRQADGTTRARLYYKFSQELQKYDYDNENLFKLLVENRKEQAKQSHLSYFDFNIMRNKGFGYERKDLLHFKQNINEYFFPLIDEIRRLRNNRFKKEKMLFYDEFKISPINPINLIEHDDNHDSLETCLLHAFQNIFRDNDSYIFEMIKQGYWNGDPEFNRKIGKESTLLQYWNKLFLSLRFDQDYFNLEDIFFSTGKALSDLSGMINLKGITSYEQSPLIRQVSGFAMLFLSMRQTHLFTENYELFNDLSLIDALLKIPYALAIDTFESTVYSEDSSSTLSYSNLWQQIEKNNKIDFDFASDGFFSAGNTWQIMPSLFNNPYSSLEYVLALIVILAEQPYRDRRNSLEKKLNLLLTTNTELPFVKRLQICGFSSPFDIKTIRKASFAVCDMLQI